MEQGSTSSGGLNKDDYQNDQKDPNGTILATVTGTKLVKGQKQRQKDGYATQAPKRCQRPRMATPS